MQMLAQTENAQVEITPLNMYNKFIDRVRRNLHVVLSFSPIGSRQMFVNLTDICI